MKQRKKSSATSRLGVNYTRTIVEGANSIFQEVHLQGDIGNDAYLELIMGEQATGCVLACQIKSGESYIDKKRDLFLLKGSKDDFEYWHSHVLHVAGIVYSPKQKIARWIDITKFLEANSQVVSNGPYTIPIRNTPRTLLTDTSFSSFRDYWLTKLDQKKEHDHFGDSLKLLVSRERRHRIDGIYALVSHRTVPESWYYLALLPTMTDDIESLSHLVYLLSYVVPHPDVLHSARTALPPEAKATVHHVIASVWRQREVERILSTTTGTASWGRGSKFQSAHMILRHHPMLGEVLLSILVATESEDVRSSGLLIYAMEFQHQETSEVLEIVREYGQRFPDDSIVEFLPWIQKQVRERNFTTY